MEIRRVTVGSTAFGLPGRGMDVESRFISGVSSNRLSFHDANGTCDATKNSSSIPGADQSWERTPTFLTMFTSYELELS